MNKTAFLTAFAVAACVASAGAQVQRLSWDSPSFATPSVRDLISAQPAPATPKSSPKAPAAPAPAAVPPNDCPDAPELKDRTFRLSLKREGADAAVSTDFVYDFCQLEVPRDEPRAPAYTHWTYKSAKGDVLNVDSNGDKPTSTVSLAFGDDSFLASRLPIFSDADLLSGRALDLGKFIVVKTADQGYGSVTDFTGTIAILPAK